MKEKKEKEKRIFLLLISLISYAIATTRLFYSLREGKQKKEENLTG
jgi:hypothetical protein